MWRTKIGPATRVVEAPWLEIDVTARSTDLLVTVGLPPNWRNRLDSPIHVVDPASARLESWEVRGAGAPVTGVRSAANEAKFSLPHAERRLCRILIVVRVRECRWLPIGRMGTWPVRGERYLALHKVIWVEQEPPGRC